MIRKVRRLLQVIAVFGRYFGIRWLRRWRRGRMTGAQAFRQALQELGGTWIKMGQALALRFDLLPEEYCYELFKLMNEVKPFPYEQAREIIRQELGDDPETIFRSFDREAFGAASIGQVHRAVLHSGENVAVKVQRPNIRQTIHDDVDLMYLMASVVDFLKLAGATSTKQVIDEFVRWLIDELDYMVEARHAHTMRQNAGDDPLEHNARVYWDYTTSRVLTTEFIDGIPLIEIVYALRDRNTDYLEELRVKGYDLHAIAKHIDWNMLNQIYAHGYFHADLHPANLFVLPNNAIGYVDFGIVGQLEDSVRDSLTQYTWHLFRGDVRRSANEIMRWVVPSTATNIESARDDLTRNIEEYLFNISGPNKVATKNANVTYGSEILSLIRRHNMALLPGVVAFLKTLAATDAVRYELAPTYDLQRTVNRFFGRMMAQQVQDLSDPAVVIQTMFDYSLRMRRLLRSSELQEQAFATVGTAAYSVWRRVRFLGSLAAVMGLGLYLVLSYPGLRGIAEPGQAPEWPPVILLVALVVLIMLMIFQTRRLPAEEAREQDARAALARRWDPPQTRGRR